MMTNRQTSVTERNRLQDLKDKNPDSFTQTQQQELSQAIYQVNEQSRQMGETAAQSYIQSKYPDAVLEYGGPSAASQAGDFDQVWRVPNQGPDGDDLWVVVEAKGGTSPLGSRQVGTGQRAEQGTTDYFNEIVKVMAGRGETEIADTPFPVQEYLRD
jgi:hypothetical protein